MKSTRIFRCRLSLLLTAIFLLLGRPFLQAQVDSLRISTPIVHGKISLSNPIALVHKVRIKLEYRENQGGLVIGGSVNYFSPNENFGYQAFIEGRYYFKNTLKTPFAYGKFGYGNSTIMDFGLNTSGPYDYAFAGAGIGFSGNLGKRFFHEFNIGAKYCMGTNDFNQMYTNSFFYLIGAGTMIDCNYHIGLYLNPTYPSASYIK